MANARLVELRARAEALRSDEPVETGLLDQYGQKIWRSADPPLKEIEQLGLLWWFIAHQEPKTRRPAIHPEWPEAGYFRYSPGAYASEVPAALWLNSDGEIAGNCGFRQPDGSPPLALEQGRLRQIWPWLATRPISYEEYERALTEGKFPEPPPSARRAA